MKIKSNLMLIAIVLCTFSCQKAGIGGNASIAVFVKQNGQLMPNAEVYLKFNTSEEPSSIDKYDMKEQCANSGHFLGHTHFTQLHQGKYFILAQATDSITKQLLSKGQSVIIDSKNKNTETDIIIDL